MLKELKAARARQDNQNKQLRDRQDELQAVVDRQSDTQTGLYNKQKKALREFQDYVHSDLHSDLQQRFKDQQFLVALIDLLNLLSYFVHAEYRHSKMVSAQNIFNNINVSFQIF